MTTRIAVIDPSAGIAGDMTLGALLDTGLSDGWLRELPGRLGMSDVGVDISHVDRASVRATKVAFRFPGHQAEDETHSSGHQPHDMHHGDHPHGRHLREILEQIDAASLSPWVRKTATRAFTLLGEAEGRVHGVEPMAVHLHEVGAADALLDIVGAIEGFERLRVDAVYHRPVALGNGWVRAAHGEMAVPAPATSLLLQGLDVRDGGPVEGEATTPTGAALIRALSQGRPPEGWRLTGSGWGAGTRNPATYANVVRILLGEAAAEAEMVGVVLADIDDMSPEYVEPLRHAIFAAGALDCTAWIGHGKKGRPVLRVEALAHPQRLSAVQDAVLEHSSTAGVRTWNAYRKTLQRSELTVEVAPSIFVRVKILKGDGAGPRLKPEYDDVVQAASQLDRPAVDLAHAARRLAEASLAAHESGSEERTAE